MTDATITAEKLLQSKAVQIRPEQPYIWASGWKSPIYCDNRRLLSQPYVRDYIKSELCNVVFSAFNEAELIAGVATAGIPWGIMVADQLKLPFIYVRSKPKEHGLGNQIEGEYQPAQKVVVVEDLVSTGKSSLQVIDVLQEKGLDILGMASIFSYDFLSSKETFDERKIKLISLTDYPSVLQVAINQQIVSVNQQEVLLKWRQDPSNWKGVY